jgi:diguanylate cyclase (GGDEF)-like protein
MAIGMALLAATQVALLLMGRRLEYWPILLGVVTVYLAVSLAVGWVSELLHRERARAESLAMLDELTGLPNRRLGRRFLEREVAAAQRGRRLALVMLDIDNFKAYNDSHGHMVGDRALAAVGRALSHNTRRMDLSARWGGEEFVTIRSDTDEDGAVLFVRRVQKTLRATSIRGGPLTFSAGVAVYEPGFASADDLLEAADQALYQAKSEGRDRVAAYRVGNPILR